LADLRETGGFEAKLRKLGSWEDNLLGGSKPDDKIALPVVGHPCLWALVLVPDGHCTKANVYTVIISFDGFVVVTNDGVFS